MRSAVLQIGFMPTLTELAQLGKQALLAFVAQVLTELAALKARVEELLAENAALKAQLDQLARDASDKPPPSPRGSARPSPSARGASRAEGTSPSAPCRLPTNGPPPRSRSDCPSRSAPAAASRCRSIGSSSPRSPTSPRSPSRSCSPIASGSIAARPVTRPCGPRTRTWPPISTGPPPTGWGHGSWPRPMPPITGWASRSARCPPSCAFTPGCRLTQSAITQDALRRVSGPIGRAVPGPPRRHPQGGRRLHR